MDTISPTATIETGATVGPGTRIWDFVHIRSGARLGAACTVGRNALIDTGVVVGDRCKIQNNALIYAPAVLDDGVFIGPAAILTNDRVPRAVAPDLSLKTGSDWSPEGVTVGTGASVGAGAVVVAGVRIGSWAMVAAGAVAATDVPDFALVAGVPARFVRWIGRTGRPLEVGPDGIWRCPDSGDRFRLSGAALEPAP